MLGLCSSVRFELTSVLGEKCGRRARIGRWLCALWTERLLLRWIKVALRVTGGFILSPLRLLLASTSDTSHNEWTYTTLQRPAIDIVAIQLADCHGSILVGIHFDERKATIRLKSRLRYEAEILK